MIDPDFWMFVPKTKDLPKICADGTRGPLDAHDSPAQVPSRQEKGFKKPNLIWEHDPQSTILVKTYTHILGMGQ